MVIVNGDCKNGVHTYLFAHQITWIHFVLSWKRQGEGGKEDILCHTNDERSWFIRNILLIWCAGRQTAWHSVITIYSRLLFEATHKNRYNLKPVRDVWILLKKQTADSEWCHKPLKFIFCCVWVARQTGKYLSNNDGGAGYLLGINNQLFGFSGPPSYLLLSAENGKNRQYGFFLWLM